MKKVLLAAALFSGAFFSVSAQNNDANQLFLVDIENVYNPQLAAKPIEIPGNKELTTEEILMYEILGCRFENGRWLRYTTNNQAKGNIKVGHPFYDPSRKIMIFVSNIPGGVGGFDVYVSQKIANEWTDPKNAGWKVNSIADELFPLITNSDQLQFSRDKKTFTVDLKDILDINFSPTAPRPATNIQAPPKPVPAPTIAQQPKPAPPTNVTNTPAPQIAASSATEYRIQLGAFGSPNWALLNQFQNLGTVQSMKNDKGLTAVYVGVFKSLEEAMKVLPQVRAKAGFENAYIVGIKNGKVESVHRP